MYLSCFQLSHWIVAMHFARFQRVHECFTRSLLCLSLWADSQHIEEVYSWSRSLEDAPFQNLGALNMTALDEGGKIQYPCEHVACRLPVTHE